MKAAQSQHNHTTSRSYAKLIALHALALALALAFTMDDIQLAEVPLSYPAVFSVNYRARIADLMRPDLTGSETSLHWKRGETEDEAASEFSLERVYRRHTSVHMFLEQLLVNADLNPAHACAFMKRSAIYYTPPGGTTPNHYMGFDRWIEQQPRISMRLLLREISGPPAGWSPRVCAIASLALREELHLTNHPVCSCFVLNNIVVWTGSSIHMPSEYTYSRVTWEALCGQPRSDAEIQTIHGHVLRSLYENGEGVLDPNNNTYEATTFADMVLIELEAWSIPAKRKTVVAQWIDARVV